jgi:hypothetical protein
MSWCRCAWCWVWRALRHGRVDPSLRPCDRRSTILPDSFPPPWSVEERDGCIIVWDRNGQALTYVYFEDDSRRRSAAKVLTRDDARQIAANIAKLPSLLG